MHTAASCPAGKRLSLCRKAPAELIRLAASLDVKFSVEVQLPAAGNTFQESFEKHAKRRAQLRRRSLEIVAAAQLNHLLKWGRCITPQAEVFIKLEVGDEVRCGLPEFLPFFTPEVYEGSMASSLVDLHSFSKSDIEAVVEVAMDKDKRAALLAACPFGQTALPELAWHLGAPQEMSDYIAELCELNRVF